MLILTRKSGQVVIIDMMEDLDPQTPIGELFARGPIRVMVTDIQSGQIKLGFTADPRFLILREERRTGHKIPPPLSNPRA